MGTNIILFKRHRLRHLTDEFYEQSELFANDDVIWQNQLLAMLARAVMRLRVANTMESVQAVTLGKLAISQEAVRYATTGAEAPWLCH